jgi:hypothetical protein
VIDLLGLVIFITIISIGLLDSKSGLGPFAMYRSGAVIGVDRQSPVTGTPRSSAVNPGLPQQRSDRSDPLR